MNRQIAINLAERSLIEGAELRRSLAQTHSEAIVEAALLIAKCFRRGGKLLLFGNGGSAADAQHLAAEFVGRFGRQRRALPAIALTTDCSILTAVGNDFGFEYLFARQIEALSAGDDIMLAISTSGTSLNVITAVKVGKTKGTKSIALTGNSGGELIKLADYAIVISSNNTAHIQECHLAIGHILCELVEADLFGN